MAETTISGLFTPQSTDSLERAANLYAELANRSGDEAKLFLAQTLVRELRLESNELRRAVLERYRSWLKLTDEQGARVVTAYDRARSELTPAQQIALDEVEMDVVRHGLAIAEFEQLSAFVPWLRAWHVPERPRRPVSGPPAPFGMALAFAGR